MARVPMWKRLSETPVEETVKKTKKELITDVRNLSRAYKRRVRDIENAGVISMAAIKAEDQIFKPTRKNPISSLSRNKLLSAYYAYSDFFKSKTSTIEGTNKVNLEQDIRIFGVDEDGTPKKRMSNDERKEYWKVYNEFTKRNPMPKSRRGSGDDQKEVANIFFSRNRKQSVAQMVSLAEKRIKKENMKIDSSVRRKNETVYSGKGDIYRNRFS